MVKVNVRQARTHLSRYLKRVARGETIVVCKRNVPIAEIRPLPRRKLGRRPIGLAKGEFEIPDSFFEPLPLDLQRAFEGYDD